MYIVSQLYLKMHVSLFSHVLWELNTKAVILSSPAAMNELNPSCSISGVPLSSDAWYNRKHHHLIQSTRVS